MSRKAKFAAIAFGLSIGLAGVANAAWQPAKPIEFIATAGPGGGTDNFARAVQNIITKYKLVEQPIVVVNKAGGSGAEGYTYAKAMAGDPYKVVFGTSNAWNQPMVSKVAYNYTDLTPIAAMVQDEFLLWVKQDAPYQNVQDFLKAVTAKPPGDFKMGGRHIDAHVNNPSQSIGQWKGSTQRPLCAFSPQRLPDGPKVTATQNWHDIPTCVESGLAIPQFQQPRTVWLPGKITPDQATFYVDLMKKVQATPEWKEYIERTSQTDTFLTGDAFSKFIKDDIERTRKVAVDEGWLISN